MNNNTEPVKMGNDRFSVYEGTAPKGHHRSRSWSVTEDDGSEDGRVVCWGLLEADAVRIARLLNSELS